MLLAPLQDKPLSAIDVSIAGQVESKGVAYYRLPDEVIKFFEEVAANETIIGFEWNGTRNFGLILGK